MIKVHILAPHEGGRNQHSQDFIKGIWRVYFEDPEFPEMKSAYISKMDLKFKKKIDTENIKSVRNYLKGWTEEYLRGKKFQDIEDEQII